MFSPREKKFSPLGAHIEKAAVAPPINASSSCTAIVLAEATEPEPKQSVRITKKSRAGGKCPDLFGEDSAPVTASRTQPIRQAKKSKKS